MIETAWYPLICVFSCSPTWGSGRPGVAWHVGVTTHRTGRGAERLCGRLNAGSLSTSQPCGSYLWYERCVCFQTLLPKLGRCFHAQRGIENYLYETSSSDSCHVMLSFLVSARTFCLSIYSFLSSFSMGNSGVSQMLLNSHYPWKTCHIVEYVCVYLCI